jgi:hypothetical protein
MSAEKSQCQAQTKAGTRCKRPAAQGSDYCRQHAAVAEQQKEQFDRFVADVNALAEELEQQNPEYSAPPFSVDRLLGVIENYVQRLPAEMRLSFLNDLRGALQGASPRDFADPNTWKGLWYLLNYSLRAESAVLSEALLSRLAAVPGAQTVTAVVNVARQARPSDLLELETWKGLWFLVNHSLQSQAEAIRRRVGGSES